MINFIVLFFTSVKSFEADSQEIIRIRDYYCGFMYLKSVKIVILLYVRNAHLLQNAFQELNKTCVSGFLLILFSLACLDHF